MSVLRQNARRTFCCIIKNMSLNNLKKDLRKLADPERALVSKSFFKTGKGQYGEGDIFIGITVPNTRIIANKYKDLSIGEIKILLSSKIHEERLVAVLLLVKRFETGNKKEQKEIFDFYLKHTVYINNWDLVDLSASRIVGSYLCLNKKPTTLLVSLAKSKDLWEKRISIISTLYYIREESSAETFKIAGLLLGDKHDLIHKAIGWMLREVGKQCSQKEEEEFLKKNIAKLPRTTLRYAIERFPEKLRKEYLKLK